MKIRIYSLMENERNQALMAAVLTALLSLLAGAAVFWALGISPVSAYQNFLQGCGLLKKTSYAGAKSMLTDFTSFLNALTPLIFSALAVCTALKAGLFNIGVSGQMLISGFLASIMVGYAPLPSGAARLLVIGIGILAGGALGCITGWLKSRFRVNEVVSTIMLNYIVRYGVGFFIQNYYINPVSRQSMPIRPEARLTLMDFRMGDLKLDLPLGILLAVFLVFILKIFFERTAAGFEIRATGAGCSAAAHAGIPTGRRLILAMTLSGALAGLAGVTYYLGYFGNIQPQVLPALGFDGIAVALLGNNQPVGILFASFFITILTKGSTYMSSMTGAEAEIAAVITGLVLLFSACRGYVMGRISEHMNLKGLKNRDRKSG